MLQTSTSTGTSGTTPTVAGRSAAGMKPCQLPNTTCDAPRGILSIRRGLGSLDMRAVSRFLIMDVGMCRLSDRHEYSCLCHENDRISPYHPVTFAAYPTHENIQIFAKACSPPVWQNVWIRKSRQERSPNPQSQQRSRGYRGTARSRVCNQKKIPHIWAGKWQCRKNIYLPRPAVAPHIAEFHVAGHSIATPSMGNGPGGTTEGLRGKGREAS